MSFEAGLLGCERPEASLSYDRPTILTTKATDRSIVAESYHKLSAQAFAWSGSVNMALEPNGRLVEKSKGKPNGKPNGKLNGRPIGKSNGLSNSSITRTSTKSEPQKRFVARSFNIFARCVWLYPESRSHPSNARLIQAVCLVLCLHRPLQMPIIPHGCDRRFLTYLQTIPHRKITSCALCRTILPHICCPIRQ